MYFYVPQLLHAGQKNVQNKAQLKPPISNIFRCKNVLRNIAKKKYVFL